MNKTKDTFCNDKYSNAVRVMETCLLCLLKEGGEAHGYGLMTRLSTFGFSEEDVNISTLYRSLRKLEKQKLVKSNWVESEQGPKKRVYSITFQGKKELEHLINFFKERKSFIEAILTHYEKIKD